MSNPRDDRYYGTPPRPRGTPPGADSQSGVFFQTGQGKQFVQLPPLHSAFPTSPSPAPLSFSSQYPQQQRATNVQQRADPNTQAYGQWSNIAPAPQITSFPQYEYHDPRYPTQATYSSYAPRMSPGLGQDPHGSRRLPPLNTAPVGREERWPVGAYPTNPSHLPASQNVRSPTATYHPAYSPYPHPPSSYSYPPVPDSRGHIQPTHSHAHAQQIHISQPSSSQRMISPRGETHTGTPYARNMPSMGPSPYPVQSDISPVSEEPVIKKKRKRADASQLKVLNEVYARTAFPSTEERADLARRLDMAPRSVQIWFQNKRQSMRQTSRQSSAAVTAGSHQPFSMGSSVSDEATHASASSYGASGSGSTSYSHRLSPGSSRSPVSPSSQTPPPVYRRQSPEGGNDPRKWNSRGY